MSDSETLHWTETQIRRLRELEADKTVFKETFDAVADRNRAFQQIEKGLVKREQEKLSVFLERDLTPRLKQLESALAQILKTNGFAQVTTPIVISKAALAKMSVDGDHDLARQVFWLGEKQCLRPMLAPNLYSLMGDFKRLKHRPIRFFEIGPCFRKETDGANHTSEFTMLNVVEMGTPENERLDRLKKIAGLIADTAGLKDQYRFVTEESVVYGDTLDVVAGPNDMEVASTAMGPHPLDSAWRITETWVGLGFGLERLLMLTQHSESIGKWCKSISYVDGIRLNV